MKVLADSNVILDVLLERTEHVVDSRQIWVALEDDIVEGYLSAHCVTTIYYMMAKRAGRETADELVSDLLSMCRIATVDQAVLAAASSWRWPDFEDAVTASAAWEAGCDLIVTRDTAGFAKSKVKAMTPRAALNHIRRSASGRRRR
ncbi:MAG: PIN domain-containing protein [Bryobacteraceae bacterium]|nr:PIN domain-containing protein [Bryobacteraceae bacterium]